MARQVNVNQASIRRSQQYATRSARAVASGTLRRCACPYIAGTCFSDGQGGNRLRGLVMGTGTFDIPVQGTFVQLGIRYVANRLNLG